MSVTGGSAGTGATTSTLTEGPITGFGSIIVNGVRFDDSAAAVSDDDDAASGRDRLKLGMQVEVESESVSDASGKKLKRLMAHKAMITCHETL